MSSVLNLCSLESEEKRRARQNDAFKLEVGKLRKEKQGLKVFKEMERDLQKTLKALDALLGELPDDVVVKFANSDEFKLYEKVMEKYDV